MMYIDILLAVLIIAAISLCIYLVVSLRKINETIQVLQKDVHDLYEKTIPLLENLTELSERASKITSEAESYWQDIMSSIEKVKDRFSGFGKPGGEPSQNPVQDFVRNLRAISKGVAAFWSNFKNN